MTIPFLPLIGIDIGSSAVKVCVLSGSKQRKLDAIGLQLLPNEAIVDNIIQDEAMIEDAILSLLERLKINPVGRRAAIAIPAAHAEVKRVLVDLGKGDLEEQMNYEAEQHFQNDIAELYFRYQQLPGWSEDPTRLPMILVGAVRDIVDQRIQILRSIGLRTGVVDCNPLCLTNIFGHNYPIKNNLAAVVDVGAEATTLSLVCNGQFLYMKILPIGGEEYTRQLIQNLGMEYDSAEAAKLTVSLAPGTIAIPDEMQRVVGDLNASLAAEIQEGLKLYFESSTPIPGITGLDYVLLCGGGARTIGLADSLAAVLQVPTQIINPFANIKVNPKVFEIDQILSTSHIYSVAAGLALRRMGDDDGSGGSS
jgi:type IV pilus assembly protein PilM